MLYLLPINIWHAWALTSIWCLTLEHRHVVLFHRTAFLLGHMSHHAAQMGCCSFRIQIRKEYSKNLSQSNKHMHKFYLDNIFHSQRYHWNDVQSLSFLIQNPGGCFVQFKLVLRTCTRTPFSYKTDTKSQVATTLHWEPNGICIDTSCIIAKPKN